MPLSDAACRSAKPGDDKPYKISDAGGLFLLVEKNGSRLWRQAYRFDGKQRLIALGAYPAISLAAARTARTNTFRIAADELIAKFEAEGDDPSTIEKKKWLIGLLNGDIGDRPIADIAAPKLLDALRKIERRGRYESARRARSLAGRVFRYAIATGRAERDPTGDLAGALISPKVQHRAAITEPKAVGALLRAVDDIDGQVTTRAALQLIALTFVRPGELRHAEWKEFDVRGAIWNIPKEKNETAAFP